MAKKNQVFIDVVVDDKGTTKRVAVNAKKLGIELEKSGVGADRASKGTDKLSKGTKELDRNMKGASKQSSNTTKNFSKMSQGMGGLVGAYATLAAQVFAVSAAFQFLSEASQLKNLIAGQEALGASTGVAYKTITNSIVQATDAQLKYADAAKAAAIGTAAGLSAGQLTDLGTAAKNASFALGRDLTDSFNRLVRGVTKAEPELLDELGIILRLETATRKYAMEIGKSVGDLNAFERTQAVTNDVLDQATRKFAAIEEQMDPSAAALAQFTKSFDTLLNSFKVGVLDAVLPVLEFLTKNTMGLVAALALVGVPILKAILPSMSEWEKASKKQIKQSKKQATAVEEDIKQQKKAILDMVAAQKDAAAEAKNIVMGKGTKGGAGLDFLTGSGQGTKTQQAAAAKILKNANAQMMEFGEVRSGALKGYLDKELAFMQASYDKRVGIAQTTTSKISNFFKRMWMRITLNSKRGLKMWKFTMGAMATAAKGAAKAINVAMSAIAIVGIIALILSAAKELYRYFFPLSELEKENIKTVEELTSKYKDLTGELERSRSAREKYLAGSAVDANKGRALQSADPDAIMKDMDVLAKMDPKTEGFNKLKTELKDIVKELTEINPEFAALQDHLENGTEVGRDLRKSLKASTNTAIELANAIESLGRTLLDADKAFSSMMKGFVKPTALTSFLDLEQKAVDVATTVRESASKQAEASQADLIEAAKLYVEQEQNLAKVLQGAQGAGTTYAADGTGYSNYGIRRTIEKGTAEEQGEMLENLGIQNNLTNEKFKQADAQKKIALVVADSRVEEAATTDEVDKRSARITRLIPVQNILLKNAKDRTAAETAAVKQQTLGLTIAGKILNLNLQRVKISNKLATAQDKLATAQALYNEIQESGTDAEKATSVAMLENAKADFKLAQANATLQQEKVNLTQRELRFQESILIRLEAQRKLLSDINRLRKAAAQVQAMGGGSFESAAQARQMRMQANDQAVAAAEEEASLAQAAYQQKLKELTQSAAQTQVAGGGMMDMREVRAQAMGTAEGTALTGAQDALTDAKNAQELEAKKSEIMDRQVGQQNKLLEMRARSSFFNQAEQIYLDNVQAKLSQGIGLEEMNLDLMKAQAEEQHNLNTLIEMKQDLSNSITSNMEGAFMSIVDGSKSAKEAFAQMAKAILADIAKMIIKLLVQKAIMTAMGMADGGVTPAPSVVGAANGGVFSPLKKNSYTSGGIARGPNAGYAATLHGNEAVVPLPHNRKIPVEMKGSGSQQNNVTVNVSMGEGGGSARQGGQGDSNQANQIGDAIAKAVQVELQYQKRSGGILNPYGVA